MKFLFYLYLYFFIQSKKIRYGRLYLALTLLCKAAQDSLKIYFILISRVRNDLILLVFAGSRRMFLTNADSQASAATKENSIVNNFM